MVLGTVKLSSTLWEKWSRFGSQAVISLISAPLDRPHCNESIVLCVRKSCKMSPWSNCISESSAFCFKGRSTIRYFPLRKLLVQSRDISILDFSPRQTIQSRKWQTEACVQCKWLYASDSGMLTLCHKERGGTSDEQASWKKSQNCKAKASPVKAKSI